MPFYKCSQDYAECSNFILHEWCARLRTELSCRLVMQEHELVLRQTSLFFCQICGLPCNGFAYNCEKCKFGKIDVHCAHIPISVLHEAHPSKAHPSNNLSRIDPLDLYYESIKCMGTSAACHACRNIIEEGDTFFCADYNYDFRLNMLCALRLPNTIRHKYDKHPLKLSYSPVENHKGQYFCEVCEDDLNPEKWFYHCSECSQSIHPDCAPLILKSEQGVNSSHDDLVYKFINMKFGDVRNTEDHEHPMSFVAGAITDGDCTKCGLSLQSKFILKCLQCTFAIHSYCESSITLSEKHELVEMFRNLEKKREPKRKPQPPRVVSFYPKTITRPETRSI
ncbi:DC1, C1-like, Rho-associated protein kinase 1/2 [Artemisia annua]|uniref:DC1, C1-like, Rho-associated protein kinase 1/2 n=1 Tax=Artemisia annua TaxID=35608 RepID=A0A2U1KHK2_ARTAN|nr:DC1, C1-like, Rho-associated protein kinase 1/2 [Artemisia annua]